MSVEKNSICQIKVHWFSPKFQIFVSFSMETNFLSSLALPSGHNSQQKPYSPDAPQKIAFWDTGPTCEFWPGENVMMVERHFFPIVWILM